jgi:phenylpyruvate tautomerase PptA (4-oxalocrotonate tautomerase family)
MPFANFKFPEGVVDAARKEEIIHRTTAMFVEYFGEQVRPIRWCWWRRSPTAAGAGRTRR